MTPISRSEFVAALAVAALVLAATSHAQTARAPIAGLSRQPSAAAAEVLLDANDAVLLLLDHQTGLFQTVKDIPIAELRANTVGLAKIAELAKIPIITTATVRMPMRRPPGPADSSSVDEPAPTADAMCCTADWIDMKRARSCGRGTFEVNAW